MPITNPELLHAILARPSAPFREIHVINQIVEALSQAGVPHFSDPIGNIVVGVASKKAYLKQARAKTREPLRVFIAHMDHPGFHGLKWLAGETPQARLAFKWHGGSPTRHLEGAKVWIASRSGVHSEGIVESAELLELGRAISHGVIRMMPQTQESRPPALKATELYGGFHFREFLWREGDLLYTKAADDLVGAFAITQLAIENFRKSSRKQRPFIGLLTRAEEVGFIGAIGHLELGWLKNAGRPILGVSLETSRALPGAEIGKGPVVRLGDKYTVFDSGALRVLADLAQKILPDAHQRRVMDGGTCEATAAMVYGFPCIGISVPLGNYHNQSFEGGPDSRGELGPAPEFVHIDDVAGLQRLCSALLKPGLRWSSPWEPRLREFRKSLRGARGLLRTGP